MVKGHRHISGKTSYAHEPYIHYDQTLTKPDNAHQTLTKGSDVFHITLPGDSPPTHPVRLL